MTLPQGPRKMGTAKNMAVFIDADNLNDATALDHVLTDLRHRADRVLYKRAYGRVDSLKGIESVLWRHGVRPVSNMIVNKVTTDSALVIDAVEAVCTRDIDTVAICSGDADFVPLATWVRERGRRVLCFSLANKIFANPESFYDEVSLLEVVEKQPDLPIAKPVGRGVLPANDEPSLQLPEVAATVGDTGAHIDVVPQPLATLGKLSHDELIERVLQTVPSLRTGQSLHLSQVVATLRNTGVLAKSTKTSTWFAQFGDQFQLQPANKPNRIIYTSSSAKTCLQGGGASPIPARPTASPVVVVTLPEMVQRVLKAVPALKRGPQQLNQVVPVLRQKTILGKTAKSTTFFAQFPSHFALSPKGQPTHVRYMESSALDVNTDLP